MTWFCKRVWWIQNCAMRPPRLLHCNSLHLSWKSITQCGTTIILTSVAGVSESLGWNHISWLKWRHDFIRTSDNTSTYQLASRTVSIQILTLGKQKWVVLGPGCLHPNPWKGPSSNLCIFFQGTWCLQRSVHWQVGEAMLLWRREQRKTIMLLFVIYLHWPQTLLNIHAMSWYLLAERTCPRREKKNGKQAKMNET